MQEWLQYGYSLRKEPTCGRGSNERTRQSPYWTLKHRLPYFKSGKVNGTHILKAGGHTRLLGTSKSGRLEITENSITGLRRHSVDRGASAPTCSSIKSELIQRARTVALDRLTRNTRSFAAEELYMEEQDQLRQSIGAFLESETVVEVLLRGPESWDKIACYFRYVITNNTEKEAEIQRMTNFGPSD